MDFVLFGFLRLLHPLMPFLTEELWHRRGHETSIALERYPQPDPAWSDPEAALEQRRFWEIFERCLDRLPGAAGRVFFKREILGEETEAICKDERITASNCWVILHRARLGLRTCLEKNWFGGAASAG